MTGFELYNDYKAFVRRNYPLTILAKNGLDNDDMKALYRILVKIIFHLKILIIQNSQHAETSHYLKEIEQLFFKILLIIPLNDKYLIDTILRAISESELRLILTASPNKKLAMYTIRRASFSKIKQCIKNDSYLFKRQYKFVYLYDIFRTSSSMLHAPLRDTEIISYLNEQLRTPLNYPLYLKKIRNLLNVNLNIFQDELHLKYENYGIEDLSIIKKLFSKTEQYKLDYFA